MRLQRSDSGTVTQPTTHPFPAEKLRLQTVFFVIFLCAIWGGLSPALKISLEGVPPFGAAALRFLIGLVSLLIWGGFKGIAWWRPAVTHKHLLAFGALFVFQISVFNLGTELTSSSHSIVFLSTNPVFVALVAHFLIPNDRLNLRKGCGLLLAFFGTWVIFAQGAEFHGNTLLGDSLVLLAGFLLGTVMVFSKFLIRHLTAFEVAVWQMIYGVPAFLLLSFWMEQERSYNITASVAVALFYQGAIVAAFCFVAWTGILRRHSVSQVSAFNFTTPLLGVLLSWVLLAEPISSGFILGVSLIALGIYLVANRRGD